MSSSPAAQPSANSAVSRPRAGDSRRPTRRRDRYQRYRQLWPELPTRLREHVFAQLALFARRNAEPPVGCDDFVREIARRGWSLRTLRNLLWAGALEHWPDDSPDPDVAWLAPEPPTAVPDSRAVLAAQLAEYPPARRAVMRYLAQRLAALTFGEGAPPEAFLEHWVAIGIPAHGLAVELDHEVELLEDWCLLRGFDAVSLVEEGPTGGR